MNRRIQELADQAAEDVPGSHMNIPDEFCEKFAKLIINECCEQLLKEDIRHGGYGYNQYGLHNKLREHFRVEE